MSAVVRLDLKALLSACVHLSRCAGQIIRDVHREGQLGAHNKKADGDTRASVTMEPDEVLTIADTRAQHAIVTNLRRMFPGIRIVGEEEEQEENKDDQGSVSSTDCPIVHLEDVRPLDASFTVPAPLAQSLTLTDTCLWIDPLDGTIEFVRNNVHHVCVLIGIAVLDRPVAGVILEPFIDGEKGGVVTYGAIGAGVFGDRSPPYSGAPASLTPAMEPKHAKDPRIEAGVGRLLGALPAVISQAAGQNLLRVLRGETSVFIQASGASRWDTCAAEALLMAVGGKVTDLDGLPYAYKQGAASYVNTEGLIAARTEELHALAARALAQDQSAQQNEPQEKRARIDGEQPDGDK